MLGVRSLKIISFGPRPFDFLTCHAPIQPLYDLGVEIMENSELDLLDLFKAEEGNPEIRRSPGRWPGNSGRGTPIPGFSKSSRSTSSPS